MKSLLIALKNLKTYIKNRDRSLWSICVSTIAVTIGTMFIQGYYLEYTGSNTSNSAWSISDYIPIKPNTTYTTSGTKLGNAPSRCYYDENKTFISGVQHATATTFTDVSPSNAKYMRESIYNENINKTIINEGSTALPYEPYNPDGKWYLKKNIGKVDLGTLNWSKEEEYGIGQFRVNQYDMLFMGKLISDIFIWQEGNVIYNSLNNGKIAVTNTQAYPILRVRNEQYSSTSATDFKTEMNNKIVYFQRYTPTYTLLNDTLQTQLNNIRDKVLAYQDQTNISQVNNDLPFRLKLSAIKKYSE